MKTMKIMTNSDKLRTIKRDLGMTSNDIATLLDVSIHTVNRWLLRKGSPVCWDMPEHRLKALKLELNLPLNG